MLTRRVLLWGVLMLPSMAAGIYLGNRTFRWISEAWFRRVLGLFLALVSVRLIFKGFTG